MFNLFRSNKTRVTIQRLYGAIVTQSRHPVFYTDFGVPDTLEGRFEMVVLHTVLLCHRLKGSDKAEKALSQDIFDTFADDMDRTLREMGVGDLSVPKKMKKIGAAFYGRAAAYDVALDAADQDVLATALARNIYEDEKSTHAPALAAYVQDAAVCLRNTPFTMLARGEFPLAAPEYARG